MCFKFSLLIQPLDFYSACRTLVQNQLLYEALPDSQQWREVLPLSNLGTMFHFVIGTISSHIWLSLQTINSTRTGEHILCLFVSLRSLAHDRCSEHIDLPFEERNHKLTLCYLEEHRAPTLSHPFGPLCTLGHTREHSRSILEASSSPSVSRLFLTSFSLELPLRKGGGLTSLVPVLIICYESLLFHHHQQLFPSLFSVFCK
jgi:hypothetical protein